MCAPSATALPSAKKYAIAVLVVVLLYLVIGIVLSVLSASSWTLAPAVVAFFLNIAACSMMLCCNSKINSTGCLCGVVVCSTIAGVLYLVNLVLQAIIVIPLLAVMLSMDCSICNTVGALYILSLPFSLVLGILDILLATKACSAKKNLEGEVAPKA